MSEYIHTPFGKMPSDWKMDKSSKVIKYLGGNAFKSQDGTDEGVRWLKIANVGIEKPKWTEVSYLPIEYLIEFDKYRLEDGDIVMALTRPILSDRLKVCKLGPDDVPALLNQRVAKLESGSKSVHLDYYYHFVQTPYFVNRMNVEMAGTDPPNISVSSLNSIDLPVPPLPEQKKIAKILSTVDGHIEEVDGMIEDLKELKKGLMQKLLTEGIGHTEFKDSEVGRIPVEWEVKRFEEVAQIISGGTPSTKNDEYWADEVYWATPTDITSNGKFISSTEKMISMKGLENSSATLLPVNSVLMTSRATIGECCINNVPMSTNQGFKSFVCNEHMSYEFLYYKIAHIKEELLRLSSGSTFMEISKKAISSFPIAVPPVKEQLRISEILSSIDDRIDSFQDEKADLTSMKKGLMQQLLTGKTRVKIDN